MDGWMGVVLEVYGDAPSIAFSRRWVMVAYTLCRMNQNGVFGWTNDRSIGL